MYNLQDCILECLFSVYIQENDFLEVIIVDDGSEDKSIDVVQNFIYEHRLNSNKWKLIRQKNSGPGGARNMGIKHSQKDFILFLDGDDVLVNGSVNKLLEELKYSESIGLLKFQGYEFEDRHLGVSELNYSPRQEYFKFAYSHSPNSHGLFGNSNDCMLTALETDNFQYSACFQLINRKLLIKENILFDSNIFYEDALFNIRLWSLNLNVKISENRVIGRRNRIGSTMRSQINPIKIYSLFYIASKLYCLNHGRISTRLRHEINKNAGLFVYRGLRAMRDNPTCYCLSFANFILIMRLRGYGDNRKMLLKYYKEILNIGLINLKRLFIVR
jgi:glycosyltransferase involved in cell wall biosynthesis